MKHKERKKKNLSRRDFLRKTAVGVGAAGMVGLSTKPAICNNTILVEKWDKEAPIVMSLRGRLIPQWKLHRNSAGDPPLAPFKIKGDPQELFLVPYGCSRLRIAEFPVIAD